MRWLTLMCGPLLVVAFPHFDPSALLREVLIPADANIGTVIYRLRAADPTFDYPLTFSLEGQPSTISIDSLNCTKFNSVCQANVVLRKRLEAGRFYDFMVDVRNPRGESVGLNCSFRATNATTPIEKIFPGATSLLMVSEKAGRNTELGKILAKGNRKRMKAVLLELWGSKEFGLHQRTIGDRDAEGTILLLSNLDYETKAVHHLTVLANDPWTDMEYDTRNIAGWPLLVAVLDEQDTPPVFTIAPPTTTLSSSLLPGDLILRVHAEDGDRGNPREVRYGLVPDGNPFTSFFDMSEEKGELRLNRPLSEILSISHSGQPILLTVMAEEVRSNPKEAPAQSSTVRLALIPPGVTGATPTFGSIEYNALIDENSPTGTTLDLPQAEVNTQPGDVVTLELVNNNGTFDISPGVVEGHSKFQIKVHDPRMLDYEQRHSVQCYIVAREIGNGNFTARAKLTVVLNDVNDNSPEFTENTYKAHVPENANIGMTVLRVEASDVDREPGNKIKYTKLLGEGSTLFALNSETGIITVANTQGLDAEKTPIITLTVEAADEQGEGLTATATILVSLVDVNDQVPVFEKNLYEFILNEDKTAFTTNAFIKATDPDISPPNNEVHYELIDQVDGLHINEITGELQLTKPWTRNDVSVLKARAWDGGVPRLSSECEIRIYPPEGQSRKMLFIVPGRNPDRETVASTLRALTGARVMINNIRPYTGNEQDATDVSSYNNDKNDPERSVVEATISNSRGSVVDINRIQQILDHENKIQRVESSNTKTETVITKSSSSGDLLWLVILLIVLAILAAILLILCCICKQCPFYIPPKRRKITSTEVQKLVVKGSGHGRESKSVQVAEWFGRKEAWTPDQVMVDTEAESLRRHELERGSDRGGAKRTLLRQSQIQREASRDQLYIREGNADILRLITRGGEQQQQQSQRPVTLVADQAYMADSGKDILMRRFIDQQQTDAATRSQVLLPNAVNKLQTEHELLEASLRQQNALLRQIILDRERDLRLETQSLPAGTQTDHDAGTQTEPHYLRPPQRNARSDNDASEPSDEELTVIKSRIKTKNYRKSNKSQFRRKIKTPILEESELEIVEKPHKIKVERSLESGPKIKQTKTSELRQKKASSQKGKKRPSKSALRKEVLREISKTLEHSDNSLSDNDKKSETNYSDKGIDAADFSEDSLEEISPRSDRTTDSDKKYILVTSKPKKSRSVSVDRYLEKYQKSLRKPRYRSRSRERSGKYRSESVDRYEDKRRVDSALLSIYKHRPELLDVIFGKRSNSSASQYYNQRDKYGDPRNKHYSGSRDHSRSRSKDRRDYYWGRDRYRFDSPRRRYRSYSRGRDRSRERSKHRSSSRNRERYHDHSNERNITRSESLDREKRLSSSSARGEINGSDLKKNKYHSETDLRTSAQSKNSLRHKSDVGRSNSRSNVDLAKTSKAKDTKTKGSTRRTSRYMEWYKGKPGKGSKTNQIKVENEEYKEVDPVKENNAAKETIKTIAGSRLYKETESSARKKVAPKKATVGPEHPLLQHSEHRFEVKYPESKKQEDDDSGIALTKPSMAQKQSVFTIAYNDMHTSQLKDTTTPPL